MELPLLPPQSSEQPALLQGPLLQLILRHLHPHPGRLQPLRGHHVPRRPAGPHLDRLHPGAAGERRGAPGPIRCEIFIGPSLSEDAFAPCEKRAEGKLR